MEANHDPNTQESEIELFLRLISNRFHDLSVVSADELLSLAWMRKLLMLSFVAMRNSGLSC